MLEFLVSMKYFATSKLHIADRQKFCRRRRHDRRTDREKTFRLCHPQQRHRRRASRDGFDEKAGTGRL